MSEVAGTLVSTVLRRVRDPGGLAHSRDFTRQIISHCQRLVNAQLRAVKTSGTLTTTPMQGIYTLSAAFPSLVHVDAVRDGSRDLDEATWAGIVQADRRWFKRLADAPTSYATVGRDLLALYPVPNRALALTVVYTKLTSELTEDSTATDLSDENLPAVLDLAEIVLLLKHRSPESAKGAIERLRGRLT